LLHWRLLRVRQLRMCLLDLHLRVSRLGCLLLPSLLALRMKLEERAVCGDFLGNPLHALLEMLELGLDSLLGPRMELGRGATTVAQRSDEVAVGDQ
jgi:hypothetical protein